MRPHHWKGSPLEKFALGYSGHRMDSTSIRQWIVARLNRQSPQSLLVWLKQEESETRSMP